MKWKFSIMLIILVLFSLSAVCAADVDNSTVNNYDYGTLSADYQDSVISDDEKPDIPDLIVDDKKHVYQKWSFEKGIQRGYISIFRKF